MDTDKVRVALEKISFSAVSGQITYRQAAQPREVRYHPRGQGRQDPVRLRRQSVTDVLQIPRGQPHGCPLFLSLTRRSDRAWQTDKSPWKPPSPEHRAAALRWRGSARHSWRRSCSWSCISWPRISRATPPCFLQNVIDGLKLGFVYALIALGYTMVYGIVKLINFAHGDVFMVGRVHELLRRDAASTSTSGRSCSSRASRSACLW